MTTKKPRRPDDDWYVDPACDCPLHAQLQLHITRCRLLPGVTGSAVAKYICDRVDPHLNAALLEAERLFTDGPGEAYASAPIEPTNPSLN